MKQSETCIGCIVGIGNLPSLLIKQLIKDKKKFVVVYIGSKPIAGTIGISVHSGEIGKILDFLKQNRVSDIVFGGKINRPTFSSVKLGKSGLMLLGKLGLKSLDILRGGDDRIISYVMRALREEDYKIVAPETLVQNLLMPRGVFGYKKPSTQDLKDTSLGRQVLASLGTLDVGQSVVVADGRVLAIEAAEGTDQMLARCAKLKNGAPRGVLVKMKKSNQETKTDLPVIGVQTVLNAHKAGLNGIILSANSSLVIDIDKVINAAEQHKMFLEGI
jgi:DUF1009 family protein